RPEDQIEREVRADNDEEEPRRSHRRELDEAVAEAVGRADAIDRKCAVTPEHALEGAVEDGADARVFSAVGLSRCLRHTGDSITHDWIVPRPYSSRNATVGSTRRARPSG